MWPSVLGKWLEPLTRNNNTSHYRRGTAVHYITETTFIFKIIKSSFIVYRQISLTTKTRQKSRDRNICIGEIKVQTLTLDCILYLLPNCKCKIPRVRRQYPVASGHCLKLKYYFEIFTALRGAGLGCCISLIDAVMSGLEIIHLSVITRNNLV